MFRKSRKPDAVVDRKMIKMTVMVITQTFYETHSTYRTPAAKPQEL